MSVILKYPADGASVSSVTLPNPILGNVLRLDTKVEVRHNRGGYVDVVKDVNWPEDRINVYQFVRLTETELDNLKTFLETYAAEYISLTDHNSDEWWGVILTDVFDIVTVKDTCSYDIAFDFMGEIQ